jgi:ABC-type uncharacterized transport system involved in gliding motility auxiliary subunit
MGIVVSYGAETARYDFIWPDMAARLPFLIGARISDLRDKADAVRHTIGLLVGHDEIRPSEVNLVPLASGTYSIQSIIEKNFPQYAFQDVDLKKGDAEVPGDVDGLLITQPGEDLTERELRRIDQFVMKGKALAVFASAVNVKAADETMTAALATHGLEKLLGPYGIGMNVDVVIDPSLPTRVTVETKGGTAFLDFPQILRVEKSPSISAREPGFDGTRAHFFGVDEVAVPFASSLEIRPGAQPGARMHIAMLTSRSAVHVTSGPVELGPFHRWGSLLHGLEPQQFAIAAEVAGTLRSAFASSPSSEAGGLAQSARSARVFVLSSSQFFANPLARAGNPPEDKRKVWPTSDLPEQLLMLAGPYAEKQVTATILVFKSTLDWLSGDGDLRACVGLN